MTVEKGLELIEQVLPQRQLSKIQEVVFRHSWEGQSYKEIAEQFDYSLGYIKDTGSDLWKLLSDVLGEQVTRRNFQGVLKRIMKRGSGEWGMGSGNTPTPHSPSPTLQCDWGEAIDVSIFYDRTPELAQLTQWIQHGRCRLITILGMGGMGKTSLSVKLAEQVQNEFDYLIWRSLRHAPPLQELLADLIPFLSNQQTVKLPESVDSQISCLINYLRQHRCLLVLDNLESILQSGEQTGRYRQGYESYGQLFERVSDGRHQSCLVLTSREKPAEVSIREGNTLPVRSLQLTGLPPSEGQKILNEQGLFDANCQQLIEHYSGNPLALKIAATTVRSLFDGNIEAFLTQKTVVFGNISELLDQQFNRLSELEQQVMYWLAISREQVTLEELRDQIVPKVSQRKLLEALSSLQSRSLIEINAVGFSQQPVVMEYLTERLVKQFYYDISAHKLAFFDRYAFVKAQAKDYVREAQIRLILQPVKDKLLSAFENQQNLENHLNRLLVAPRSELLESGYAAENLLNLFWQLHSDLSDAERTLPDRDFSNLMISQASLPNFTLQHANAYCKIDQFTSPLFSGVGLA